ncbi:hypothetical protein EDD86DRAFT_215575 [Gorgonomyces haynaldii]|nr:hypothetical protein EDD86DRAFT_215575 [Gorgonomyces haynaldii]
MSADILGLGLFFSGCIGYLCYSTKSNYWRDRICFHTMPLSFGWLFYLNHSIPQAWWMFLLILLWSLRMMVNYYRKNNWKPVEDYRWTSVRRDITNPIGYWFVIAVYPSILFSSMALPVYFARSSIWNPVGLFISLGGLILEELADQQQQAFQKRKHQLLLMLGSLDKLPAPFKTGFLETGLFQYSRHPNYLGDLLFWIGIYLASGNLLSFAILGPILHLVLVLGSIDITEKLACLKYDQYPHYQKKTPGLFPLR